MGRGKNERREEMREEKIIRERGERELKSEALEKENGTGE